MEIARRVKNTFQRTKRIIYSRTNSKDLYTKFTKKNKLWKWQREQKILFKELKELFIIKLTLKIYTPSLLIVVKINILDFILGVYLVQKHLDRWYLVIYYSYKMTLLELNYNIYNKKLLGIVTAFKE